MNNSICIIGSGKEVVDRAKVIGLRVLLIQSASKCSIEAQNLADMVYICDFESEDSVTQVIQLCKSNNIVKALTLSEHAACFTAKVNDELGETNMYSELYRFFSDKLHMRRELEAASLNRVAFMPVDSKSDLIEATNRLKMPMILKPTHGVGSRNVYLISTLADAIECSELDESYIAEEFISGSEYSLECFSKGSVHVLHAVTEKGLFTDSPSRFVECSHQVRKSNNKGRLYSKLQEFVENLLNHIGFPSGPSHIEVKVDCEDNISLIEVHSRVGGDSIPELVALATGIDLYELSIQDQMCFEFDNSRREVVRESAIVFFPSPKAGKVLTGIQKLYSNPVVTYIKEPHNTFVTHKVIRKSSDRNGYAIYCIQDAIDKIDLLKGIQ
ncbi:ATP-grasp domain-containing protein [Vibrio lentus]|uniref:ATP-grasp domain-containing protein n=3 Tax=Vibrio lentus TaxID=136468 RepID=A0AA45A8N5_9VIBR|nr:ATP-grasp domain-containing protein [Vibrio lentus]MCB5358350.1 ATP-grasp domain-containing protein [Vibrio lentus]MCB5448819.1 ATP-grasp domain-containing protein [Vibrio lentus]MCB5460706.1 ATP-grasp domain-containing protein [Vibrio lentus]MCC4796141.1 ATP-grasp domain-containing protein [Vibrio lentus]MCC4854020.1 ATP-grasp domain-containing protein [Vibrio lentus]